MEEEVRVELRNQIRIVREKGVKVFMMSDFVTYCMVMWLAIIQVVRMKHHEWNESKPKAYFPDRAQINPFRMSEVLKLNPNVKFLYRLKRGLLWDTS